MRRCILPIDLVVDVRRTKKIEIAVEAEALGMLPSTVAAMLETIDDATTW